ncbi:NAD(P)H-binding protein [Deinococcus sp. KNUC1210]|uniref:NAD(P)H-binding protein n=1 Tax=Deinococcus sp. KNUC1210 TaxID=2917691 RepID=UPI00351D3AB5
MIVITGASGKIGQGIIEALLKRTSPQRIAVSVRDPQKVQHLETQGVRVRRANYSDGASLRHAFEGASQVLMVSSGILGEPGLALHRAAADAAQDVGAGRIVYTSHMAASQHSLFHPCGHTRPPKTCSPGQG